MLLHDIVYMAHQIVYISSFVSRTFKSVHGATGGVIFFNIEESLAKTML